MDKITKSISEGRLEARKAIARDPNFAIAYYNVAVNRTHLKRLGEAVRSQPGCPTWTRIDEFIMLGYDIGLLRGEQAENAK